MSDYDAVIVGGSLAGSAAAILLGQAGARVALVEKQPDRLAFKRICSHLIQPSAVPTLERLGLMDAIEAAGAVRPALRTWTRWGWIEAPAQNAPLGVNLQREKLDPLVREAAGTTPGVDLLLGRNAVGLLRDSDGGIAGVVARESRGTETELRARIVVGADGRDSKVAQWAGGRTRTRAHGRFMYCAYFEGAMPAGAASTVWLMDPQFAAGFPTDSGLCLYVAMPTKDRLPEFKRDPGGALVDFIADLPEAPPIRDGRMAGDLLGKLDLTNRVRAPVAPGLALIGDAALATDPLFGVGCGWALQSGEWLADAVAPALVGDQPLNRCLSRYRRRRRTLAAHAFFIHDYSRGRRFNPAERAIFAAASQNDEVATLFEAYATRRIGPTQAIPRILPRAIALNARRALH